MNCPVCSRVLAPVQAGPVTVDVCLGGCGGIWFDNFELQKLERAGDAAEEMLVNVKKREDVQVDYSQRRGCPRCNMVMMRHFFSPRRRFEVDECPNCGGYWLDAGELALVREEHRTEPEQQRAVDEYLAEMSVEILEPMRASGGEQLARACRIDQLFRFSSPIRFLRE
jgi:Zn-finger nucleic acid-binding protein